MALVVNLNGTYTNSNISLANWENIWYWLKNIMKWIRKESDWIGRRIRDAGSIFNLH